MKKGVKKSNLLMPEDFTRRKRLKVLAGFLIFSHYFLLVGTLFAGDDLIEKLLRLPAPPPPNPLVKTSVPSSRDISFYDAKKPPSDEAPIEDILDYWRYWNYIGTDRFCPKPSERVLERIKNEIRIKHSLLLDYVELFKDDAEFVKEIYDEELKAKKQNIEWRRTVKDWLVFNSRYFIFDLFDLTQQELAEAETYVTGERELKALARLDWEKAELFIQRLIADDTKPILQTLAKSLLYKHFLERNREKEAEKLREELKKIVADKQQKAVIRDLALNTLLMEREFQGRDDWYFSLLSDETLLILEGETRRFRGLATLIHISEPGKYKDKLLELLRSKDRKVSLSAAYILLSDESQIDEQSIRALLPLLDDQDWATVNSEIREEVRRKLISQLSTVKLPESVIGLMSVLQEKLRSYDQEKEDYSLEAQIYDIVRALGRQKDPRAIPLLWEVFSRIDKFWLKQAVLRALLDCGNFSIAEQVDAIERKLTTETVVGLGVSEDFLKGLEPETRVKLMLAETILNGPEGFSEELVLAILERIEILKKTNPNLALKLRKELIETNVFRKVDIPFLNSILLRELGDGSIQIEGILKLLADRKELREKYLDEIYAVRNKNPLAEGISACLLERDYRQILQASSIQAKATLLACGRLIRASIPIEEVAIILKTNDRLLFDAAVKYLESEDSPQARQIIWSLYPGQAKILGANPYFGDEPPAELSGFVYHLFESVSPYAEASLFASSDRFKFLEEEKALQKEVLEKEDLLGIYAYKGNIVRIYKDKAVYTQKKSEGFYVERVLQEDELERLKKYIAESGAELLPPFFVIDEGCRECKGFYFVDELLMLGKGGGRRVFVAVPEEHGIKFLTDLEDIFKDFQKQRGKLIYPLQNVIPGFQVLYSGEDFKIEGVWKKGNDFRVLVREENKIQKITEETERELSALVEKGRMVNYEEEYERILRQQKQRVAASYLWRKYESGNLKEVVPQPDGFDFSPYFSSLENPESTEEWKRKTSGFLLFVDSDWLTKKDLRSGKEERLFSVKSYGAQPVLSADGRWALIEEEGRLKRYDLRTRKVLEIPLDEKMLPLRILCYVPSLGKFLLGVESFETLSAAIDSKDAMDLASRFGYRFVIKEFYLFDAATASFQAVSDKAMPLAQQTWRPLQATIGNPNQFWVAMPDLEKRETTVGIFSVRNFQFKPLMKLPKIVFDSMDMWVDEQERKVYISHGGNLLAVSLP